MAKINIKLFKMKNKIIWIPKKKFIGVTNNYYFKSLKKKNATKKYLSWLKDKKITRYLNTGWKKHTIKTIKEYIKNHDNYNNFHVGIFEKQKGNHIGNFNINLDHFHKTATTNFMIGEKKLWGKGVVVECRALIIDWIFNELKFIKIYGTPFIDNFPMILNYQKQGFKCEGILKNHKFSNVRKRCDVAVFSLFNKSINKKK